MCTVVFNLVVFLSQLVAFLYGENVRYANH